MNKTRTTPAPVPARGMTLHIAVCDGPLELGDDHVLVLTSVIEMPGQPGTDTWPGQHTLWLLNNSQIIYKDPRDGPGIWQLLCVDDHFGAGAIYVEELV